MKEDFTMYDIKPEEFINYLRYYGEHFNKKLCKFACREMGCCDYTKDKIESLLQSYSVLIKENRLYDAVYIANWLKQLSFGKGVKDEKQLILLLKDIIEKEGHLIFNRWYADCAKEGIPVEWEDMI